jgi:hypothetical protein
MSKPARWERRFPSSANNFDLHLTNPETLDCEQLKRLLHRVLGEKHRGLTLSSRADQEFQRWFDHPDTPLKSDAYVLLSNWFMTQSGDRQSTVATACEHLWDVLFPCRPLSRLSSPEPGRNHVMLPGEFDRFWQRVIEAQAGDAGGAVSGSSASNPKVNPVGDSPASNGSTADRLRATFNKDGLSFEVEGPPRAMADFLQLVSNWEVKTGDAQ